MNDHHTLAAVASVAISAAVIVIVYRAAALLEAIDHAEEELSDTFPTLTPHTPAESTQEPTTSTVDR